MLCCTDSTSSTAAGVAKLLAGTTALKVCSFTAHLHRIFTYNLGVGYLQNLGTSRCGVNAAPACARVSCSHGCGIFLCNKVSPHSPWCHDFLMINLDRRTFMGSLRWYRQRCECNCHRMWWDYRKSTFGSNARNNTLCCSPLKCKSKLLHKRSMGWVVRCIFPIAKTGS